MNWLRYFARYFAARAAYDELRARRRARAPQGALLSPVDERVGDRYIHADSSTPLGYRTWTFTSANRWQEDTPNV